VIATVGQIVVQLYNAHASAALDGFVYVAFELKLKT
jgi:uncharacterized membrane protein YiaA